MKMRGYSVLFVSAFCVVVLCGAAAVVVVAQDVTPEKKAAEEAKVVADTAKQKAKLALNTYETIGRSVGSTVTNLNRAIAEIGASNTIADTLSLPDQVPSGKDIKKEIEKLERAATEAKNAALALEAANVDSLSNQGKEVELTNKMKDVESKVEDVGIAVAAVTEESISTFDAAIMKAGELQTAAEEAGDLWNGAVQNLATQLVNVDTAVAAINRVKNDIESAKKKFANNRSPQTKDLNNQLTDVATNIVTPSLETLTFLKNVLQKAKDAAEEAGNKYTALAAKAKELKEKSAERKRKAQTQPPASEKIKDYSVGPLCSLALPAFFFCCCVLFGMWEPLVALQ